MGKISSFLIIGGILISLFIFGPVIKEELGYRFNQWGGVRYSLDVSLEFPQSGLRPIVPIDKEFGIVIPKIVVNAEIFPEIDPGNPQEFLPILKKGVACAKGSAYPDEEGNVFLFNVGRDNAVFFLIGKLEKDDEIDIFYKNKRYKYEVTEKAVVSQEEPGQYVKEHTGGKTLTLQTGYPPGTTLKRLIVIARQKTGAGT
ncbi:MAG: sortase [Patescibacteria group bacterium]